MASSVLRSTEPWTRGPHLCTGPRAKMYVAGARLAKLTRPPGALPPCTPSRASSIRAPSRVLAASESNRNSSSIMAPTPLGLPRLLSFVRWISPPSKRNSEADLKKKTGPVSRAPTKRSSSKPRPDCAAAEKASDSAMASEGEEAKAPKTELATFAAGCFWGVESAFHKVPGVVQTSVGYTQGSTPSPTYESVCNGGTGHCEAVLVEFDPSMVGYQDLLAVFWEQAGGYQDDAPGSQYRSGIYFHSKKQEQLATKSLKAQQAKYTKSTLSIDLMPTAEFHMAEEYHQHYYFKKHQEWSM